jgi:hypothetical protein
MSVLKCRKPLRRGDLLQSIARALTPKATTGTPSSEIPPILVS